MFPPGRRRRQAGEGVELLGGRGDPRGRGPQRQHHLRQAVWQQPHPSDHQLRRGHPALAVPPPALLRLGARPGPTARRRNPWSLETTVRLCRRPLNDRSKGASFKCCYVYRMKHKRDLRLFSPCLLFQSYLDVGKIKGDLMIHIDIERGTIHRRNST